MKYPSWDMMLSKGKNSFIEELGSKKRRDKEIAELVTDTIPIEVKEIMKLFSLQKEVEAITLGGSRVRGRIDESSDYDLYVYYKKELSPQVRRNILASFCRHAEIGNSFWEIEDNGTLHSGISLDIIYRNIDQCEQNIAEVCEGGKSFNGYTTCLWNNIVTSTIIYDKNRKMSRMKQRFAIPYPKNLKDSIIKRNMNLLTNSLVSYEKQIKISVDRQDVLYTHNRMTAFLESYFDILFALNEVKNPGGKFAMEACRDSCSLLPQNFEEHINSLFYSLGNDLAGIKGIIEKMIQELKQLMAHSLAA
ncbi:MAG: nucleotidyltransferase domain-containing protein [Treponema sp.]|nr:nucleotidyltransferase domain-containing protein [Treponema sp.]